MATLRSELQKRLITLDSDFNRNFFFTSDKYNGDIEVYRAANTRKLPKAYRKYGISMDDEQAGNAPNAGATTDPNKPADNTQNTQNGNTDNKDNKTGVKDKAKGFWKKFVEWFKNFWKTIWQNIKNTWNTLTANYKHLEQEVNKIDDNLNTQLQQILNVQNDLKKAVDDNTQATNNNTQATQGLTEQVQVVKKDIIDAIKTCGEAITKHGNKLEQNINNLTNKLASLQDNVIESIRCGRDIQNVIKSIASMNQKVINILTNNYKGNSADLKKLINDIVSNNTTTLPLCVPKGFRAIGIRTALDKVFETSFNALANISNSLPNVKTDQDVGKFIDTLKQYGNEVMNIVKDKVIAEVLTISGVNIDQMIQNTQNANPAKDNGDVEFTPMFLPEIALNGNNCSIIITGGMLRVAKEKETGQNIITGISIVPFANGQQSSGNANGNAQAGNA